MYSLALESLFVLGTVLHAQGTLGPDHPCRKIVDACKAQGFVPGEYKTGKGLWKDCVDPLIQGVKAPANSKLTMPSVDQAIINECKAKHANFGEGPHVTEHMQYVTPGAPPPPPKKRR